MTRNQTQTKGATHYMNSIKERLLLSGFKVETDVKHDEDIYACVGARKQFHMAIGVKETFFIVNMFSSIDSSQLYGFSAMCRKYAKRHKLVPYIPLTGNVTCYSVAVCDEVNLETVHKIETKNPVLQFGFIELLVLVDLKEECLHYSHRTPWHGILVMDDTRIMAETILRPSNR